MFGHWFWDEVPEVLLFLLILLECTSAWCNAAAFLEEKDDVHDDAIGFNHRFPRSVE